MGSRNGRIPSTTCAQYPGLSTLLALTGKYDRKRWRQTYCVDAHLDGVVDREVQEDEVTALALGEEVDAAQLVQDRVPRVAED